MEPRVTILDWLIAVTEDGERYQRLQTDPDPLINESEELSDAQKEVLLSHDSTRIREMIEEELGVDPLLPLKIHVTFPVPGPIHITFEAPEQSEQ